MRTATPISTCSRMSDWAPSATVDLDAAVHRPRMHDQRVRLGIGELLLIEPEIMEVFLRRGHERTVHALALEAQHHHDVGIAQALAHVARGLDPEALDCGRQQRRRRDHAHPRAQRVEQDDVRARDARVQNVAADGHDQPLDAAFVAADGEGIEQRLGGMLVRAVAGIDHRTVDLLGQKLDRARGVMAHHDDVRMHGVERDRSVDQRLALAHGGGADRHVHNVGAEPFAGELEGGLGAGRDLEEQVDERSPAQRNLLLVDLAVELDEVLGEVEQSQNLLARKPFDPQQIALVEDEGGLLSDVH